jgi:broad-specificity NMP kinase
MKSPEMIGICGGKWGDSGVGKTTVSNILAKTLDYYPISFIEPVKEAAKKYFDWNGTMDY